MAAPDTFVVDAPPVVGSSWESDPAMRPVPIKRSTDPVPEPDTWREPDIGPRARDVERAALGEEIDAAAKDWRLDPQWHAQGLAQCAGHPERPDRQVTRRHRDSCSFRNQPDQRIQRGDFPARQDIRAIRGGGVLAQQPEAVHEIVDVGEM